MRRQNLGTALDMRPPHRAHQWWRKPRIKSRSDPRGLRQDQNSGRRRREEDQQPGAVKASWIAETKGPTDAGLTRQRHQDEDRRRMGATMMQPKMRHCFYCGEELG